MLTFLATCSRKAIVVDAYDDEAVGHLGKARTASWLTDVTLRPRVTFAPGTEVDAETFAKLHESAHRGCFVASSVKTAVSVEPHF
jgi:organic hydroperoxide reductase OsmC/OhrA